MAGYDAAPPDKAELPEAFRQALPPDPLLDRRLAEALDASLHVALAPASAPPVVAPVAPVRPPAMVAPHAPAAAVAPHAPAAAVAPHAPAAAGVRPDLNRLRSMADKVERDVDPGGVHRSAFIRAVLLEVFHDHFLQNPEFQRWMAAARDLYTQGGAGKALAQTPFMKLPASMALDAALKRRPVTAAGLTWSILLGIVWGVWYCNDAERRAYRVQWGHPVTRGDDPAPFDSEALAAKLGQLGAVQATAGAMACIWVIDDLDAAEPRMYTHICLLGRFHHSSFLGGADIGAGGEWTVENGVITEIGGSSGHYQPATWRFVRALMLLRKHQMIQPGTQVELYEGAQRRLVPAQAYLDRPHEFPEPRFSIHKPARA